MDSGLESTKNANALTLEERHGSVAFNAECLGRPVNSEQTGNVSSDNSILKVDALSSHPVNVPNQALTGESHIQSVEICSGSSTTPGECHSDTSVVVISSSESLQEKVEHSSGDLLIIPISEREKMEDDFGQTESQASFNQLTVSRSVVAQLQKHEYEGEGKSCACDIEKTSDGHIQPDLAIHHIQSLQRNYNRNDSDFESITAEGRQEMYDEYNDNDASTSKQKLSNEQSQEKTANIEMGVNEGEVISLSSTDKANDSKDMHTIIENNSTECMPVILNVRGNANDLDVIDEVNQMAENECIEPNGQTLRTSHERSIVVCCETSPSPMTSTIFYPSEDLVKVDDIASNSDVPFSSQETKATTSLREELNVAASTCSVSNSNTPTQPMIGKLNMNKDAECLSHLAAIQTTNVSVLSSSMESKNWPIRTRGIPSMSSSSQNKTALGDENVIYVSSASDNMNLISQLEVEQNNDKRVNVLKRLNLAGGIQPHEVSQPRFLVSLLNTTQASSSSAPKSSNSTSKSSNNGLPISANSVVRTENENHFSTLSGGLITPTNLINPQINMVASAPAAKNVSQANNPSPVIVTSRRHQSSYSSDGNTKLVRTDSISNSFNALFSMYKGMDRHEIFESGLLNRTIQSRTDLTKEYVCTMCGDEFYNEEFLLFHLDRSVFILTYYCKVCDIMLTFHNKCTFWKHILKETGKREEDIKSENNFMRLRPYLPFHVHKDVHVNSAKSAKLYNVSGSRTSSYEIVVSPDKASSSQLHVTCDKGSSSQLDITCDKRSSPQLGVPCDKGSSLQLDVTRDKGSSSQLDVTHDKGTSYKSDVTCDKETSSQSDVTRDKGSSSQLYVTRDKGSSSQEGVIYDKGSSSQLNVTCEKRSSAQLDASCKEISSFDLEGTPNQRSSFLLDKVCNQQSSSKSDATCEMRSPLTLDVLSSNALSRDTKKCPICKIQCVPPSLWSHFQRSEKHYYVSCHICGMTHFNSCSLSAHTSIHFLEDKKHSLVCPECGETLPYSQNFKSVFEHLDACCHFNIYPAIPCHCGSILSSVHSAKDHILKRHVKLFYKCTICCRKYPSVEILNIHHKSQHPHLTSRISLIVQCCLCDKIFQNPSSLQHHVEQEISSANLLKKYKMYRCMLCSCLSASASDLNTHIEIVHIHKPKRCTFCFALFKSRQSLVSHIVSKGCPKKFPKLLHVFLDSLGIVEKPFKKSEYARLFQVRLLSGMDILPIDGVEATQLRNISCSANNQIVKTQVVTASSTDKGKNSQNSQSVISQSAVFIKKPSTIKPATIDRRKYQCHSCKISLVGSSNFEKHMSYHKYSHLKTGRTHCVICKKMIVDCSIRSHMEEHQTRGVIVCTLCHRRDFASLSLARNHSKNWCYYKEVDGWGEACFKEKAEQPQAYKNTSDVDSSEQQEKVTDTDTSANTNPLESDTDQPESEPLVYPCLMCGLAFSTKRGKDDHVSRVHDGTRILYFCMICKKRGISGSRKAFHKKHQASSHIARKHRIVGPANISKHILEEEQNISSGQVIPIEVSDEDSTEALPPKRLRLEAEGTFLCGKCGFSDGQRDIFDQHIKIHNLKEEPQCPECGLCFTVNAALKKHLFAVHRIRNVDEYVKERGIQEPPEEIISEDEQMDLDSIDVVTVFDDEVLQSKPCHQLKEKATTSSSHPWECTVCYRKFSCEVVLKSHIRNHGMAFIRSRRHKNHNRDSPSLLEST